MCWSGKAQINQQLKRNQNKKKTTTNDRENKGPPALPPHNVSIRIPRERANNSFMTLMTFFWKTNPETVFASLSMLRQT